MRFSLRHLLVAVAFVSLTTAYVVQLVRYRDLADRYDAMEQRYTKARAAVKALTHITVVDQPPRNVTLEWPSGWPSELGDEWKDLPAGDVPAVMVSRFSGMNPKIEVTPADGTQ